MLAPVSEETARKILSSYRSWAVVGWSPNPGLDVVMDRCPAVDHPRLIGAG
jgi:predicted CoA-binding protein